MRNHNGYQYGAIGPIAASVAIQKRNSTLIILLFLLFGSCKGTKKGTGSPQQSSPMVETIRKHERISADDCLGERTTWEIHGKSAQLFVPKNHSNTGEANLIIHFHGAPKVSEFAICKNKSQLMLTINGGSGSSSYEAIFAKKETFKTLLKTTAEHLNITQFSSITLSGWSAGYGAIRALLREYPHRIDNVVLLDGLHTSYVPEKLVLFKGGQLDTLSLRPFLDFAQKAVRGEKRILVTHGSIFPGTYASTTETTEYLINKLGLKRVPKLRAGPVGMQQLGEVRAGGLTILSYAGNTAPDHVDHIHGLGYFLDKLGRLAKP